MQLNQSWIKTQFNGQSMQGYLVRPQAAGDKTLPTVLVIQEIWGVDEHIQDMADRFAMAGYQAIAPDLYSLGATPEPLTAERIHAVKQFLDTMPPQGWGDATIRDQHIDQLPSEQGNQVRETLGLLFAPRDNQKLIGQLKAWVDYAQSHGAGVVTTGYCMGGQLSFLLAANDPRPKAAVCNYGTAPTQEEMQQIKAPIYGFYGGTDHRITDAVPEVANTMKALGKTFHYKIYESAGHAFFNDSRVSYDVDAARSAWALTLDFFLKALSQ